jgi:hypothetical protein
LPFVVRASRRSTPLMKVAAGPAIALAFLGVTWQLDAGDWLGPALLAALLTAVGAGFALDDPAANTLGPSPTSLRTRRCASAGLAGIVLAIGWSAQLVVLEAVAPELQPRFGGLTLEACAFVLIALAISVRSSEAHGEPVGGAFSAMALPGVVGLLFSLSQSPLDRYPIPNPMPGENTSRWWWVIASCAALLVWCTRDPGRTPVRTRTPRVGRPSAGAAIPRGGAADATRPGSP